MFPCEYKPSVRGRERLETEASPKSPCKDRPPTTGCRARLPKERTKGTSRAPRVFPHNHFTAYAEQAISLRARGLWSQFEENYRGGGGGMARRTDTSPAAAGSGSQRLESDHMFPTMVSDSKMDARRTSQRPWRPAKPQPRRLRSGGRAGVPGGLLHLGPPAVVRVADEQQDLAPEQHEGRVCGDHGAHLRVQALQAVEAAVRAVGREEP